MLRVTVTSVMTTAGVRVGIRNTRAGIRAGIRNNI